MTSATMSAARRGRRSRAVVAVNGAVVVTVLMVVAAVALVVRPPAPPGIAEFAPQASKSITKAPPGQSSQFGNRAGQCALGATCLGNRRVKPSQVNAVVTTPSGVPSALQCFTWPDGSVTQTFDPQSPPCIATWSGHDNGGATAQGVTASTIRIAVPKDTAVNTSTYSNLMPIVSFINTHFELYGRHLQLVSYTSAQTNDEATKGLDATDQHADAEEAASLHPFAATDFIDDNLTWTNPLPSYVNTLASHHVLSVTGGMNSPFFSAADQRAHAPYEWTYLPSVQEVMGGTGAMACRQLVGHDASHSQQFAGNPRKFAVLMPINQEMGGRPYGLGELQAQLDHCGLKNVPVATYSANDPQQQSSLSEMFTQWRSENITTVIFYTEIAEGNPWAPQPVASSVGYYPEWVIPGTNSYRSAAGEFDSQQQSRSTFGVGGWNKTLVEADSPWYQAELAGGGTPTQAEASHHGDELYHDLLLLASGVQMAGPDLTPQSFGRALHSVNFPNPGAGTAPSYQAHVAFGGANPYAMVSDLLAFWLDVSAGSQQEAQTSVNDFHLFFCYVGLGNRFNAQTWPRHDGFYQSGCR